MNQPNASQKRKRCKVCKTMFVQFNSLQVVCSTSCAYEWSQSPESQSYHQKAVRAETRERKQALKTLSDWTKDAQKAFNKFIRLRDADKPCVTCGESNPYVHNTVGGVWDCGHYKTIGGFPELRFDESNAHKQCKTCNGAKKGKAERVREAYDIAIVERVGQAESDRLNGPNEPKRYRIPDLKNITATYKAKAKELEAE